MSPSPSTTAQVRAQVESAHRKSPHAKVIGIKTNARWQGEEKYPVDGQEFRFVQCDSALQVRESIIECDAASVPLVIITHLSEADLGEDVLARLAKRSLLKIDAWSIVKDKFRALKIDPGLRQKRWLAEALLEGAPSQGYPPVPSGFLDEETAWGIVLRNRFGFGVSAPDLRDLLMWALNAQNIERYLAAPEELRKGTSAWIVRSAGEAGVSVFDCIEAGYGQETTPIGLACYVIFHKSGTQELREASVRLERFAGNNPIPREAASKWAEASGDLLEKLIEVGDERLARGLLERSDQILREALAHTFAYLSDYSPTGFELRLERYGKGLQEFLRGGRGEIPQELSALAQYIFDHKLAKHFRERAARVEMSLRLLRWLAQTGRAESASFDEAANSYARDGGFVDWARHLLYGGEGVEELSRAYARLAEIVAKRREAENRRFGELLVNWTEVGSSSSSVLPIENVLSEAVTPAARSCPVLFVVIDGMGMAVFRELIEDIVAKDWIEWGIGDRSWPPPVITALPSITEVSRATLFTGRLTMGKSGDEVNGFQHHTELLKVSKSGFPPVLFHKSTLTESGRSDLSNDLRKEIASEKRVVVGVVVNAVDDHLLKGEQVAVPWALKHMPVLEQLLYAAKDAGRVVIITSDHGHVIERQMVYRKSEPGERYRSDDGRPLADELAVTGARVVAPGNRLIAPWSENVRYGAKKHGYHGGISPQECVVPLAVLSRPTQSLSGWIELPHYRPEWWDLTAGEVAERTFTTLKAPTATVSDTGRERAVAQEDKFPLFGAPEETPVAEKEDWIGSLLKSPAFAGQTALAGRSTPPPELVRNFLAALDERGGTLLKSVLAQKLGQPELRINGIVSAMRRLLNVDGYDVLSVDETSGSVNLNYALLKIQFELK